MGTGSLKNNDKKGKKRRQKDRELQNDLKELFSLKKNKHNTTAQAQ